MICREIWTYSWFRYLTIIDELKELAAILYISGTNYLSLSNANAILN